MDIWTDMDEMDLYGLWTDFRERARARMIGSAMGRARGRARSHR